jgi:hypothetical protein
LANFSPLRAEPCWRTNFVCICDTVYATSPLQTVIDDAYQLLAVIMDDCLEPNYGMEVSYTSDFITT